MNRGATDRPADVDLGLGEFLFRVNCRIERYSGCLVGTLIAMGVFGTAFAGYLVDEMFPGHYVVVVVTLIGLVLTFVWSFALWRMERSVLRLYENGFQLVRGDFVNEEVLLEEVKRWAVRDRWLRLELPDSGWMRLRLGPVGIEDVADYLEERLPERG